MVSHSVWQISSNTGSATHNLTKRKCNKRCWRVWLMSNVTRITWFNTKNTVNFHIQPFGLGDKKNYVETTIAREKKRESNPPARQNNCSSAVATSAPHLFALCTNKTSIHLNFLIRLRHTKNFNTRPFRWFNFSVRCHSMASELPSYLAAARDMLPSLLLQMRKAQLRMNTANYTSNKSELILVSIPCFVCWGRLFFFLAQHFNLRFVFVYKAQNVNYILK